MAVEPISFEDEEHSNAIRRTIAELEPRALRTFTPTLAVLAKSAGIFHWTPEGRRLYDFSSGVLVANLGHNPRPWINKFADYLGWTERIGSDGPAYFEAVPITAYNAITPIEAEACERLVRLMQSCPGGGRMQQVLWAASGSEAIQKALWAALHFQEHRQPDRNIILATRDGFHGKKGLAGACTGDERSPERDPRVKFISFPKIESMDVSLRAKAFDATPYRRELEMVWSENRGRIAALVTEPYLGGAGSFHPPAEYLQLLEAFCREHDVIFILDEVQSNFGRTGSMFAYETYGLEPDIVVLGKGLGNGAPVSAAVGRADLFASLDYGEGSDTYSANPIACAAVLATLDLFEANDIIGHSRAVSKIVEAGLVRLQQLPFVKHVRGEGMVWGVEMSDFAGRSASDIAAECVRACYLGAAGAAQRATDFSARAGGDGIHLLGPLAGCVLRVSPPLVISAEEATESLDLLYRIFAQLARELGRAGATRPAAVAALHKPHSLRPQHCPIVGGCGRVFATAGASQTQPQPPVVQSWSRSHPMNSLGRFIHESADQWRVPARFAAWVFWSPVAGTAIVAATRVYKPLYRFLLAEDGLFEWAQFACFAATFVTGTGAAIRLLARRHLWQGIVFGLFALVVMFVAGEEISWGQRMLGIETPEQLQAINRQNEITLHNIGGVLPFLNWAMLLGGGAGSVAYLLNRRLRLERFFDQADYLWVPPFFLASFFFVLFAYKLTRVTVWPRPGFTITTFGEWAELCLAVALCGHAWLNYRRLGWDTASGSGPRTADGVERSPEQGVEVRDPLSLPGDATTPRKRT